MKFFELEVKEHIAFVTLNNGPLCLFDTDVYLEMTDLFRSINNMDDVFSVIVHSSGKMFSAGGSIDEISTFTPARASASAFVVSTAFGAVYSCKKPTIALVHKRAIGAGLVLAACCDIIIASPNTKFSLPEATVGIIGASEFVELLLPKKLARYYAMTGEAITAEELQHLGSVLRVVGVDELLDAGIECANELCTKVSPLAASYVKQAMNRNDDDRLAEKFLADAEFTKQYVLSSDFKEGVNSFFEKRPTQYTGK